MSTQNNPAVLKIVCPHCEGTGILPDKAYSGQAHACRQCAAEGYLPLQIPGEVLTPLPGVKLFTGIVPVADIQYVFSVPGTRSVMMSYGGFLEKRQAKSDTVKA